MGHIFGDAKISNIFLGYLIFVKRRLYEVKA